MKSALYRAQVMHRRLDRFAYRFVYRVFSLHLDLDELPALTRRLRLFSHNRFNLLSFHDRDHGPRDGAPIRPWLEDWLRRRGIELEGGSVTLLCFPRVLGYVFNPMSVYYCRQGDGGLRAIVCEVRNTFGEMHHYLLAPPDGGTMDWDSEYRARKQFHVSPFIGSGMEYRFRFREPVEYLRVYINELSGGAPLLQASIAGVRAPLTDTNIVGECLRLPLMPLWVMAAIHWQALKLWLRGARFHRMPARGLYMDREEGKWTTHGE